MAVKSNHFIWAAFLAILLTSCATSDPSDDFSFDYSSAEISDFNGYWGGRVDCRYANGFEPLTWVRIVDGRGEFGFGNRYAAWSPESLYSDFDSQNGKISWHGELVPWNTGDKMPISFRGHWRENKFKLKGRIGKKSCSGVITGS